MDRDQRGTLDDRLVELVEREWQTAAQLQRLCGGETLEVAKALDRLWEAGRIERDAQDIGLGTARRSGGAQLRRIRYRRSLKS